MEQIIYLNDNNINVNDRFRRKQDRRCHRKKFRITTFRTSRISRVSRDRVLVQNGTAREQVLEGSTERVYHWRERGCRALLLMGRTIKRNAPIIIQLVISYFICLILTAIFLRYMFAL